ncbi:MAG: CDP-glycerol glycerophosphotransferase family protein [Planctomycetota bacterium]
MLGWLRGISHLWREVRSVGQILALPAEQRQLVVYSEDTFTYNQLQGYLDVLRNDYGQDIIYVTSALHDPLLAAPPPRMRVFYVKQLLSSFLQRLDSGVLFLTMPDLHRFHVKRPAAGCTCVYAFHSLNSIHEVYRENAFDHYDTFLCTGPHHVRELQRHFEYRELPQPELRECGYYKLDRIAAADADYEKQQDDPVALIAPSWGQGNLLEQHGATIVEQLLTVPDLQIIVRPHPCFFQSIYPAGQAIVEALEARYGSSPRVTFERSIDSESSFHESDLLISDFSGAAFEYAFATLRPVLFVDGPRKTMNPNWQALGLPTFEDQMREQIGQVIAHDEVGQLGATVSHLLDTREQRCNQIEQLCDRVIFNFGESAAAGAAIIHEKIHGSPRGSAERKLQCQPSMSQ